MKHFLLIASLAYAFTASAMIVRGPHDGTTKNAQHKAEVKAADPALPTMELHVQYLDMPQELTTYRLVSCEYRVPAAIGKEDTKRHTAWRCPILKLC